jgi:hypothetical protein
MLKGFGAGAAKSLGSGIQVVEKTVSREVAMPVEIVLALKWMFLSPQ